MAIFTILYGNYYPPHGEFKLICIGKFARRTWVNFTQQYGKNRQTCQQNKFYYPVWQLLLYYYREFSSKILYVYKKGKQNLFKHWRFLFRYTKNSLKFALLHLQAWYKQPDSARPLHLPYISVTMYPITLGHIGPHFELIIFIANI